MRPALPAGVIAFPSLHNHSAALHVHGDPVEPIAVRFLRRETEAVLIAEFFLDPVVDLVDWRFLRHFEIAAARFARELLENFLAVGPLHLPLRYGKSPAPPPAPSETTER